MLHIIEHTIIDSIKLLPFLFIAYLIMEFLEHKTGEKTKKFVQKSGRFGPILGGIAGIFPQCGFSAAAANLYAGRVISLGTLIAIFLSTSDEMLPILISEAVDIKIILQILGIKLAIGIIAGIIIDFVIRKTKKEEESNKIIDICEHEHCHCENGILKSALKHTLHIFLFILIITLVLNIIINFVGEETIAGLILNRPVLGPIIAGAIGLIPNCASSVMLTQLYVEGIISMATMITGLLVGAGVGLAVLFRANKNLKENLKITVVLYGIAVISGILLEGLDFWLKI